NRNRFAARKMKLEMIYYKRVAQSDYDPLLDPNYPPLYSDDEDLFFQESCQDLAYFSLDDEKYTFPLPTLRLPETAVETKRVLLEELLKKRKLVDGNGDEINGVFESGRKEKKFEEPAWVKNLRERMGYNSDGDVECSITEEGDSWDDRTQGQVEVVVKIPKGKRVAQPGGSADETEYDEYMYAGTRTPREDSEKALNRPSEQLEGFSNMQRTLSSKVLKTSLKDLGEMFDTVTRDYGIKLEGTETNFKNIEKTKPKETKHGKVNRKPKQQHVDFKDKYGNLACEAFIGITITRNETVDEDLSKTIYKQLLNKKMLVKGKEEEIFYKDNLSELFKVTSSKEIKMFDKTKEISDLEGENWNDFQKAVYEKMKTKFKKVFIKDPFKEFDDGMKDKHGKRAVEAFVGTPYIKTDNKGLSADVYSQLKASKVLREMDNKVMKLDSQKLMERTARGATKSLLVRRGNLKKISDGKWKSFEQSIANRLEQKFDTYGNQATIANRFGGRRETTRARVELVFKLETTDND
ncbi:hypothetical protein ACFL96_12930, partial [Thermoproteota archaeon]